MIDWDITPLAVAHPTSHRAAGRASVAGNAPEAFSRDAADGVPAKPGPRRPAIAPKRQWKWVGRRLINTSEKILAYLRRNRVIDLPPGTVKVNLGSGLHVAPGWINLDGSLKTAFARWPRSLLSVIYPFMSDPTYQRDEFVDRLRDNTFILHDLQYGLPFPSDSVDFIFSSHVIHHLYRDQARCLLSEVWRVLKAGGTIRIAVPDLEFIFNLYRQGRREDALAYFFYPSVSRSAMSTRHYQYDFALLKELLNDAGFDDVRHCEYRQGATPDLELLDRLPEESLYVEANK